MSLPQHVCLQREEGGRREGGSPLASDISSTYCSWDMSAGCAPLSSFVGHGDLVVRGTAKIETHLPSKTFHE